jgi:hypothetical protein
MNNKTNYIVNRTDIYTNKSQNAQVENMVGYKTLSNVRGCQPFPYPGTPLDDTKTGHLEVNGFGFSQYSDFNKCNTISKNSLDNINNEILKNNINVNDIFEMKYQQRKNQKSRKDAMLGENVVSYRIINKKK